MRYNDRLMRDRLLLILALLGLPLAAAEPPYAWPLPFDNGVSSTFMEFRSNHFHVGIDLRTYRQTGFPVLALGDGVVERIKVAVNDTGRSLFLRLSDGRLAVYYHLQSFAPELEEIVRAVQRETGKRYFREYPLPRPWPVRRGQVIAASGDTGAGMAHLHLEVRDADGRYLNPLALLPDRSPDTKPPEMGGVLLRSRAGSLVNGEIGEAYVRLRPQEGGYVPVEPLTIDGPVDWALNGWDVSSGGRPVAPYQIEARFDGQAVYSLRGDSLAWEEHNQLGLTFDMSRSGMGRYFYNLMPQPGHTLNLAGSAAGLAPLRLDPGEHRLRVVLRDRAGQETTADAPFTVISSSAVEPGGVQERDVDGRHLAVRSFVNGQDLMLCLDEWTAPASQVALRVMQGSALQTLAARPKKRGVFFLVRPANAEPLLQLRFQLFRQGTRVEEVQRSQMVAVLQPGSRLDLQLDGCRLSFAENAVNEPRLLLLDRPANLPVPELPMLSGAVSLAPGHFAFMDAVTVSFPQPAAPQPKQVGVFKYNPWNRRWSWVRTSQMAGDGGFFGARILLPGTYALFRDPFPPTISLRRRGGRTLHRLKQLIVRIRDVGMGVDGESVRVAINGQAADCDYDADWQGVRIHRLEALHRGDNRIFVVAADYAGNQAEATLHLRLR